MTRAETALQLLKIALGIAAGCVLVRIARDVRRVAR